MALSPRATSLLKLSPLLVRLLIIWLANGLTNHLCCEVGLPSLFRESVSVILRLVLLIHNKRPRYVVALHAGGTWARFIPKARKQMDGPRQIEWLRLLCVSQVVDQSVPLTCCLSLPFPRQRRALLHTPASRGISQRRSAPFTQQAKGFPSTGVRARGDARANKISKKEVFL